MLPQEQVTELDGDPRCLFPVEIELHHVVGRRRRPDAIDHAGSFQVCQDQAAFFLAHERILPRNRRHLDRFLQHRQPIQPVQLCNPRHEIVPRPPRRRHAPKDERNHKHRNESKSRVTFHLKFLSSNHIERNTTPPDYRPPPANATPPQFSGSPPQILVKGRPVVGKRCRSTTGGGELRGAASVLVCLVLSRKSACGFLSFLPGEASLLVSRVCKADLR